MTDERRERYEAAILAAGNGESVGPRAAAQAAMAVADEEHREAKERHREGLRRADEHNNALMDEVQRYADGDERPVLWSVYNQMHLRAANAEADIARVERHLTAWEQQLPETVKLAPGIETVRRDLGIEGAPNKPVEAPRCAECGHPKADHQDADEPVSVGLCTVCDEEGSDEAHHDYEPEGQQ